MSGTGLFADPQVSNDTFAICDWELNQVWEAVLHECVSLFSYAQGGGMDSYYESADNGHDNIGKKRLASWLQRDNDMARVIV